MSTLGSVDKTSLNNINLLPDDLKTLKKLLIRLLQRFLHLLFFS